MIANMSMDLSCVLCYAVTVRLGLGDSLQEATVRGTVACHAPLNTAAGCASIGDEFGRMVPGERIAA